VTILRYIIAFMICFTISSAQFCFLRSGCVDIYLFIEIFWIFLIKNYAVAAINVN